MKKTDKKKYKDSLLAGDLRSGKNYLWVERHSREDGVLTRLESEDVIERKPKKEKNK